MRTEVHKEDLKEDAITEDHKEDPIAEDPIQNPITKDSHEDTFNRNIDYIKIIAIRIRY